MYLFVPPAGPHKPLPPNLEQQAYSERQRGRQAALRKQAAGGGKNRPQQRSPKCVPPASSLYISPVTSPQSLVEPRSPSFPTDEVSSVVSLDNFNGSMAVTPVATPSPTPPKRPSMDDLLEQVGLEWSGKGIIDHVM